MMKNYIVTLLALLFLMNGFPSLASAEEKLKAAPPHVEMLDDSIMKKLDRAVDIPNQHKLLATLEGTWYYEMHYWEKDGADPQVSSGTMANEMTLDGRFLSSKTNLILNIGGQNIPYKGWGMLGYDDAKKEYTSVWADNLHAGIIAGRGQYDEKLNIIEERGTFKNPLMAKELGYRSVTQFIDHETYQRTFFVTGKSGSDFKAVEINFVKR